MRNPRTIDGRLPALLAGAPAILLAFAIVGAVGWDLFYGERSIDKGFCSQLDLLSMRDWAYAILDSDAQGPLPHASYPDGMAPGAVSMATVQRSSAGDARVIIRISGGVYPHGDLCFTRSARAPFQNARPLITGVWRIPWSGR